MFRSAIEENATKMEPSAGDGAMGIKRTSNYVIGAHKVSCRAAFLYSQSPCYAVD